MPEYIWPCDINTVSQEFGGFPNSFQPDGHTGMDFAVPVGTKVLSPADGVIRHCDWASVLGWPNPYYVAIDFDGPANGDQSAGIVTIVDHGPGRPASIVAHLSNNDMVYKGKVVKQGDVIGLSGSTGRSTGPHVHFEMLPDGWDVNARWYGRVNPRLYCSTGAVGPASGPSDVPLKINERVTGPNGVVRRQEPKLGDNEIDRFPGDVRLTIAGFTAGEWVEVNGFKSNIWFKGGISGGYMWCGGFNDASTNNLTNLIPTTPPPSAVDAKLRTTFTTVYRRTYPDKNAPLIDEFPADRELTIAGYVRGTDPDGKGNNIWFVGGITGGYIWSNGFTNKDLTGLPDLTAGVPTTQPPAQVAKYDFKADFDFVQVIPAHASNVELGRFPEQPERLAIHQMGTPGRDTMNSTINEFKRENAYKSSHFVVSEEYIVQMVSLKDRAYHAGPVGNDYIGIETDPYQSPATIASVRKLEQALFEKYGRKIATVRHRDIPGNATECGSLIDLKKYEVDWAPAVVEPPVTEPPVVEPPVVTPPKPDEIDEAGVLTEFFRWLIGLFLNRKK